MSRVIKFRAWDEARKKMQKSPKFVSFKINSQGEMSAENYTPSYKLQQMPVMQFTGLLDANGVDVYEGDLIDWMGGTFYIKWEDSDSSFFAVRTDEVIAESGQEWAGSCVVIGNIYQNKELLSCAD